MKYLSALLTQASGKLGGAVAAKNRGGNYFRAKVAPVQPRTTAQQQVRANLAALSSMWRTLTKAEISGWNSLGSSVTLHDSLGNAYSPSGAQLFMSCNRNLSSVNETVVTTPPAARPDLPDLTPVNADIAVTGGGFNITTGLTVEPTGNVFLVRSTPNLSAGISFVGTNLYRIIATFPASSYLTMDPATDFIARFGPLVAGSRIGVELSMVNIATGFAGTPASVTTIVGA